MDHLGQILAVVLLIVVALSGVESRTTQHDWFEHPKGYFSEYWFDGFWLNGCSTVERRAVIFDD
jgi:hypothetical protein